MSQRSDHTQREIDLIASEWVGKMDRSLSAEDAAALAVWREADPRHAEALARFQATWVVFAHPRPEAAAGQVESLVKAFDRQRRSRRKAAILSLMVIAAGLTVVGVVKHRERYSPAQVTPLAFSGEGDRLLDDGTRVDTSSRSDVQVVYSSTARWIDLKGGEAFFNVAHDSQRPFVVRAGPVLVRAVGTAFNVDLRGETVEVIVTEGQVAVGRLAAESTIEPAPFFDSTTATLLRAGTRLVFSSKNEASAQGSQSRVEVLTPEAMEKRLPGRLETVEFSNDRLEDVANRVSRYSRADFLFEDSRLRELRVSARLRVGDVEAFVHLMSVALGLRVERQSETHFVIRREP